MCKLILITNRKLCQEDFLLHIEKLADAHPSAILLREKDLTKEDYLTLAVKVSAICAKKHVRLIMHTHNDVAAALGCQSLHVPLMKLRQLSPEEKSRFPMLGTSCHSAEDAREAQALGADYIFAGHIFDTDCKRGLPGRGLPFLTDVCMTTTLPVYAIGGITPERVPSVLAAGAKGVCIMSAAMTDFDRSAWNIL